MKKKPNFEKVSVSLPPEVHEWLKAEAKIRAEKYGEAWSASRIVQEAIREYRARHTASFMTGQAMPDMPSYRLNEDPHTPQNTLIRPSTETLDGGLSTATTARYQKAGRRKSST
jgi:hypothetical protein